MRASQAARQSGKETRASRTSKLSSVPKYRKHSEDGEDSTYYENIETGEITWEQPADFIESSSAIVKVKKKKDSPASSATVSAAMLIQRVMRLRRRAKQMRARMFDKFLDQVHSAIEWVSVVGWGRG